MILPIGWLRREEVSYKGNQGGGEVGCPPRSHFFPVQSPRGLFCVQCLVGWGRGITAREVCFSYHLLRVSQFSVTSGIISASDLGSGILLVIVLALDICCWFSVGESEARLLVLHHLGDVSSGGCL